MNSSTPQAAVRHRESTRVSGFVRAQAVSVEGSAVLRPEVSGGLSDAGLLIGEDLLMSGDAVVDGWEGASKMPARGQDEGRGKCPHR